MRFRIWHLILLNNSNVDWIWNLNKYFDQFSTKPTCWILLLGRPNVRCSQLNCCSCFVCYFHSAYIHNYMSIVPLEYTKWMKWIFVFHFITSLQPVIPCELMMYQRGCDTWQATAKMVQPCIFLMKSHECTVNCAISSRNFSNHYILSDNSAS